MMLGADRLGFLQQTRQGGRNRCSLFAVTWRGIDEGPHDAKPDPVPSNLWKPEHAHLRDEVFVRRWKQCKKRRHVNSSSRYSDTGRLVRPTIYCPSQADMERALENVHISKGDFATGEMARRLNTKSLSRCI